MPVRRMAGGGGIRGALLASQNASKPHSHPPPSIIPRRAETTHLATRPPRCGCPTVYFGKGRIFALGQSASWDLGKQVGNSKSGSGCDAAVNPP